jgi:hypothetical protein
MMPPDSAFTSLEDAIGDIHGVAKIIEKVKAKNPEYIKRGYTDIRSSYLMNFKTQI